MIDTHAHIYLPDFRNDLDAILARALEAGITDICMPAIDEGSIAEMNDMSHNDIRFHKMAGWHPCEVKVSTRSIRHKLDWFFENETLVAVGETGLDYHWSKEFISEQKKSFEIHLSLARDIRKPIVIHNRNSTSDMLDLVETYQNGNLTGVWHCFNGTVEEGQKALDLGLNLGIGGVVTYKNAGVDYVVRQLPLNAMILETDAPYLSPVPKRGKRNEPSFVMYTAKKIATLFEIPVEEVAHKTTQNARSLFGLREDRK